MPVRIPATILMPFFNHISTTIESVNALFSNFDLPEELVLIDDGSTESLESRAKEIVIPADVTVKLVRLPRNGGFIEAVNTGFTYAEHPFIVLLNNDTIPLPGWLNALYETMERFPDAGAVGSKLLTKEYRVEEAGGVILYHGEAVQLGAGLNRHDPSVNFLRKVSYCSGASLMIRRTALGDTAEFLLESAYGRGYYEDTDLCELLRSKGYNVYYQPRSEVVHLGSQTFGRGIEHDLLMRQNRMQFCERWMDRLSRRLIETTLDPADNYIPLPSSRPKITIIILCWNGLEYTKQAIASIQASTSLDYILVPVDNGSTDGTPEYLRNQAELHPWIKPVYLEYNTGFAGGINAGLATATTEFIAILNNDVVVTSGWLERMLVHFYQFPTLGLIGPMACNVSGVQNIPFSSSLDALDPFARMIFAKNAGTVMATQRIVGFAWVMRQEVLHKVGGFHLDFGKGNYEDDDYCIRVLNSGYQIGVAQDVFIYHKGSASWNSREWQHSMNVNLEVLHKRWGQVWSPDGRWIEWTPQAYQRNRDYFPPVSKWEDMQQWLRVELNAAQDADVANFAVQSFMHTDNQAFLIYAALSTLRLPLPEHALRIVLAAPKDRTEVEALKLWISVLSLYSLKQTEDMRQTVQLARDSGYALPDPPESAIEWDLQWRELQAQCETVFSESKSTGND